MKVAKVEELIARENIAGLYLDMVKRCVTDSVYGDAMLQEIGVIRSLPYMAHTMIGLPRLDNLQWCVESVLADKVPGDLIETGVWRGGACIFMRAILAAYGVHDRTVWVADSFEGFPEPDPAVPDDVVNTTAEFAAGIEVSLAEVQANFERYGLLDDQVRFLKGWFADTLPAAPIERLAIMRLDGDLYRSTKDALDALYPRLAVGGFCIVDDYKDNGWLCKRAVDEYRHAHGITEPLVDVDWTAVYWRKERA